MTTPQDNTRRLAGLTGLALVAVIGIGSLAGSNSARDDLTPKAEKALAKAGLSSVRIDFDGREAKLSNGTPEDLARAEKIVEGVDGVRWATIDTGRSASLTNPPTFSLTRNATGANISGVVPNAEVAAQIKAAAKASFEDVTGKLTVDRTVGTADWFTTLPALIPSVADVTGLSFGIDGDSVAIGGTLPTQAGIDALSKLVEPAIPGLTLDNTLRVGNAALDTADTVTLKAASIQFPRGSAGLDAEAREGLDAIVEVLDRNPGVELEIGGRAGSVNPARGEKLINDRLDAVKDYLVAAGVDESRLSTRSYGSDSKTGDPSASQYRGVDFIVKGN